MGIGIVFFELNVFNYELRPLVYAKCCYSNFYITSHAKLFDAQNSFLVLLYNFFRLEIFSQYYFRI